MLKIKVYYKVVCVLLIALLKGKFASAVEKLIADFDEKTAVLHFRCQMHKRHLDISAYSDEEIKHNFLYTGESVDQIAREVNKVCNELKLTAYR